MTTLGYLRLRLRDGAEFNPMLLLDFLRRAASSAKASAGLTRCAVYQGIDIDFEVDEDGDDSSEVETDDDELLESLQDDAHRDFYLVFVAPDGESAASLIEDKTDGWSSTKDLLSRVFHVGRRCAGDLLGGGVMTTDRAVDEILSAPFASLEFYTGASMEERPGGLVSALTGSFARLSPWRSSADARDSDLGTQPPPSHKVKLAAARLLERNRYV